MSAAPDTQFGRYEVLEQLGAGGMAVVYRARYTPAPGVTKAVVIKRMRSQYAEDPAFVEMFLNEARVSVEMSHGNIVQVFDFGQLEGEYFLAMELVDGQPLSRVLKRVKARGLPWLPAPLAVGIAIEMCRGLHYAHTREDAKGEPLGLVHRDISPDNVLLSYAGEVKITDFGIAKARLEGRHETEVGVVKGKYHYFSPEQAQGEELDARSDVFAVGVVLYQMLCGHLPAEGTEFEVMTRLVEGRLTPPTTHNPGLDADLQEILRHAMATDKTRRYRSAEAMQQSLSNWLAIRAPLFPTNARRHLMSWLFHEDVSGTRPLPSVPASFLEHLKAWRGDFPVAPALPSVPVPVASGSSGGSGGKETWREPGPVRGTRKAGEWPALDAPLPPARPAKVSILTFHRPAYVDLPGDAASDQSHLAETEEQNRLAETQERAVRTEPVPPTGAPRSPNRIALALLALAVVMTLWWSIFLGLTRHASPLPPGPLPANAPIPGLVASTPPSDPLLSGQSAAARALAKGRSLLLDQEEALALEEFQACLEHDAKFAPCHFELGKYYARQGDMAQAHAHFKQQLASEPEGPAAMEALRIIANPSRGAPTPR